VVVVVVAATVDVFSFCEPLHYVNTLSMLNLSNINWKFFAQST